MAKSVNKVILLGTLGKDPELKYTPQGTAVAKWSMATNSSYKDKQSGEWKEQTEWHNIVAWQRTAEVAAEYLKKGRQVYIEGRLQTRSWDDKETGAKKYMTEIVVNEMVLVGGKRDGESSGEGGSRARGAASGGSHFDQRSSGGNEDNFSQAPANSLEITDEDIPF
jgi:single-strand DNA-binding protein